MAVIRDKTGKKKQLRHFSSPRSRCIAGVEAEVSASARRCPIVWTRNSRRVMTGIKEEEFTRFFLLLFFQFFFPSFSSYLFESDHYIPILFYLFLLQHFYVSLLHFSLLFFLNIFSFFSLIHTRSSSFSLFSLFLL